MGVLSPALKKQKGGQSALLAPAAFQVPLHQNNHARVMYFGVTYSATLQWNNKRDQGIKVGWSRF